MSETKTYKLPAGREVWFFNNTPVELVVAVTSTGPDNVDIRFITEILEEVKPSLKKSKE